MMMMMLMIYDICLFEYIYIYIKEMCNVTAGAPTPSKSLRCPIAHRCLRLRNAQAWDGGSNWWLKPCSPGISWVHTLHTYDLYRYIIISGHIISYHIISCHIIICILIFCWPKLWSGFCTRIVPSESISRLHGVLHFGHWPVCSGTCPFISIDVLPIWFVMFIANSPVWNSKVFE